VLGYLYEGYRAQWKKDKKLHPIIPIVYYHGKEAWSPVTLGVMLENYQEALQGYVPGFRMVEINLQAMPDEAILGLSDVWLRASLQVQKYSYDPEKLVDRFVQIFETLNTARGGNFFQQFGIYYFWVSKIRDEKLQELVVQLPANKKAEIMEHVESILETRERLGLEKGLEQGLEKGLEQGLEKGLEQGLEKGLEQGLEKGKREVAIKGYRNGVSIEVICLMTGYTEEELKKIVLEEEK
jgi:predicted transposase/invertase (TIGR01784 family)